MSDIIVSKLIASLIICSVTCLSFRRRAWLLIKLFKHKALNLSGNVGIRRFCHRVVERRVVLQIELNPGHIDMNRRVIQVWYGRIVRAVHSERKCVKVKLVNLRSLRLNGQIDAEDARNVMSLREKPVVGQLFIFKIDIKESIRELDVFVVIFG